MFLPLKVETFAAVRAADSSVVLAVKIKVNLLDRGPRSFGMNLLYQICLSQKPRMNFISPVTVAG